MPVKSVARVGSELHIYDTNGTVSVGLSNGNGRWIVKSPPGPVKPPPGGTGKITIVDPLPTDVVITNYQGDTFTMSQTQLQNCAGVILACAAATNDNWEAIRCCLACIGVESIYRMYSNDTIPESFNYPHEMVGSDNASVGLFQQQVPDFGWGNVRECMEIDYSTRSFLGGPSGPRGGRDPEGLFDLGRPFTEYATLGEAIQDVQVSAHPDRYERELVAVDIILSRIVIRGSGGTGKMIDPFPGSYDANDPFGSLLYDRKDPGHRGSDWRGHNGEEIPAICAGTVVAIGWGDVVGNYVTVNMHDGYYYAYIHMIERTNYVSVGQDVSLRQPLGRVGNTGTASQGAHLHVTISDVPTTHFGEGNITDPWVYINARL